MAWVVGSGTVASKLIMTAVQRCLLIDNYDSYTYNLFQLIAEVTGGKLAFWLPCFCSAACMLQISRHRRSTCEGQAVLQSRQSSSGMMNALGRNCSDYWTLVVSGEWSSPQDLEHQPLQET